MWCENCHCEDFDKLEVISEEKRLIDEFYVEHYQYVTTTLTIECKECGHIFVEEFVDVD